MAALTTIATIGGLLAGAAATTAGVVQQRRVQKDAREASKELGEVQRRREDELAARKQQEDLTRAQRVMRERQRMQAGKAGVRDTILTGPLGIPGGGTTYQGKTLLGM